MRSVSHKSGESGIVLLTTLLVLMMISALMAAFYAAVNSDVRATAIDRDQTQAYAAAHAGLEKLTSDLAQLFETNFAPTGATIQALANFPPAIPGFEYTAPGGSTGSGYAVAFANVDGAGEPAPISATGSTITAGPYKGLKGLITKYPITITARSTTGNAEVRLRREIQTVAVPVFQFGVFSETDLTFYAGDSFDFGGRVHTNGNLFICNFVNSLTFTDYITAVKEVVRAHLSNGLASSSFCTGNVLIPTAIGSPGRNLKYTGPNEASITSMPGPSQTVNTNWTSISVGTYRSIIRNGLTGANRLDLPLVSQGATPIDLIKRAPVDEDTTNLQVYSQRFYSQASLRILLSDRAADITVLPEIDTAVAPVSLDWLAGPPAGYTIGATNPPIARSVGPMGSAPTATGGLSSGNINVSAIPTELQINGGVGLNVSGHASPVVCTGKTLTAFTGCTLATAVAGGATISASFMEGSYTRNATQIKNAGSVTAGTNRTLTVVSGNTLAFSKRFFWLNSVSETDPTPRTSGLMTCTGYDATPRFTGCAYSGSYSGNTLPAPANGWVISTNQPLPLNTTQIGGFIKIERQNAAGVWTDVTMEILNLGIADNNQEGELCGDPNPNAVIRLQRHRDNGGGTGGVRLLPEPDSVRLLAESAV